MNDIFIKQGKACASVGGYLWTDGSMIVYMLDIFFNLCASLLDPVGITVI